MVEECRRALEVILPFTEAKLEFLNILLDKGVIDLGWRVTRTPQATSHAGVESSSCPAA
jgi:hypothetical protein